ALREAALLGALPHALEDLRVADRLVGVDLELAVARLRLAELRHALLGVAGELGEEALREVGGRLLVVAGVAVLGLAGRRRGLEVFLRRLLVVQEAVLVAAEREVSAGVERLAARRRAEVLDAGRERQLLAELAAGEAALVARAGPELVPVLELLEGVGEEP